MKHAIYLSTLCLLTLVSLGCRQETIPEFEPNRVYSHGLELEIGYPMQQALDETQVALTDMFGTPDQPRVPDFLTEEDSDFAGLLSLEKLQLAAGPVTDEGGGLYRAYCMTCHGLVGNGRGTTAALLDPYPRDYRLGKFKFKSTDLNGKPTREDLAKVIAHGVDGTSMKPYRELADAKEESDAEIEKQVDALVDYVIYLSWRGELERYVMMVAGEEVAFEDGDTLYNPQAENFEEQKELIVELAMEIGDSWLEAPDRIVEVTDPPEGTPVPATIEELEQAIAAGNAPELQASIDRGRELFASEKAACAKCHGKLGYGDGQTQDYDDWAKDWTTKLGLDPTDYDSLVPFIARGVLPPRKILPRDFRQGLFRGGSAPEDIYRRIAGGIAGTPMPAAAVPEEDIWDLVNYVRSMRTASDTPDAPTTPAAETPAAETPAAEPATAE